MPQGIPWGVGREQQFLDYACLDLERAIADRSQLEQQWADWLDQYRAPTSTEVKRFPWENASNRTLPFTAMNADPLIARFVTTLHAPQNLWSLQPLNERWVDATKPLQDYMQFLDHTSLHMYDVNYRAIIEFVKLGTCIWKHGWHYERRTAQTYAPMSGELQTTPIIQSRPFVDHVSLMDFIIPPEAYHIQADHQGGAAWVAERFYLRQGQFLARAQGQEPFQANYNPEAVEKVKQFIETRSPSGGSGVMEDKKFDLDRYSPSNLERIELWEVHARFDTTGNGTVDDVVAVIHLGSRTLLRATLNPYRHGMRPYSVARYFRGDGFYGIGECEQSEVFQEMLTQLWNYQMDNVLAVNAPMLGVKRGADVVPGEPIYPLKMWSLDDPSKDIKEIKLSEVYPSLPQFSGIIQEWGKQRTGLTDVQRGDIQSLPSRTPATSMLSLMQEGNRRFDLSIKELRAALDEVGLRTLQNIQQFLSSPRQNDAAQTQLAMMIQALGQPEGAYVAVQLLTPVENIESGIGVAVSATSGSVNKEVEKQGFLSLLQLQSSLFVPMYVQLAQLFSNPQVLLLQPAVAETAKQLFAETAELQKRLYEQFDLRNSEDVALNAAVLLDFATQTAPQSVSLALAAGAAAQAQEQRDAGAQSSGGDG